MGFFAFVISTALVFASVPVLAQGDPIGAVDNIPPEAPSNIAVVPDLGVDPNVTVSWDLSPSDASGFTSTNGGSGSVVAGNDVQSYIIRVKQFGAVGEGDEIARVAPGQTTYTDDLVELGLTYEYLVSATDGTSESALITSLPVSIGEPPRISIAPTDPFGFGEVVADGNGAPQSLILFNGGLGNLSVGFLQFEEAGFEVSLTSDLAIPINAAQRFEIEPNQQQEFFIGFNAIVAGNLNGEHKGTLFIITNDPLNLQLEVELTATITLGIAVPIIDVRNVLAFGAVAVGGSSPKTLKISNTGGLTLNAQLAVTAGDLAFSLGSTELMIAPGESAEVEVTFAADDNIFYDGIITITSDDPFSPSVDVAVKGLGKLQGEGVKPVTRKIHKARVTFPISLDFTDLEAVAGCALNAATNIQASLASGFLVINVTCTEGSTIVDFEVVADEDAGEPAITVEESLADLIEDIEDPGVEVFPDLVGDLGAVDTVVDETETVSLQPTDADGADVVGWFSRTGTRVDFDDFFLFADGFGSTVDSDELDVLDIAGPSQGPPDGVINFDDFFRFADDFGKTVANAAEIQDILGG
jgi:hypothetical protein